MDTEKTLLIIHGYNADSRNNWYPWLRDAAQKRGYHVLLPDLSPGTTPTPEAWLATLQKTEEFLRGKCYVVAHSLGALTACLWLMNSSVRVEKLILVAPVSNRELQWLKLRLLGYNRLDREVVRSFMRHAVNWEQVQPSVGSTTLLLSDNDPIIPLNVKDDYEPLAPEVRVLHHKFHFSERTGNVDLPEIFDVLP